MATFQVDIQTLAGLEYLTNVYHVDAPSLSTAYAQGVAIANHYVKLIPSFWRVTAIRATTPTKGDGQFYSLAVNIPGTRGVSGDLLPLFNRFRVIFAIGNRRPLVKFLIGVQSTDLDGSNLDATAITFVNANFVNALLTDGDINLVGPDGSPVVGGNVALAIGMRQLRRASKRKSPVI